MHLSSFPDKAPFSRKSGCIVPGMNELNLIPRTHRALAMMMVVIVATVPI